MLCARYERNRRVEPARAVAPLGSIPAGELERRFERELRRSERKGGLPGVYGVTKRNPLCPLPPTLVLPALSKFRAARGSKNGASKKLRVPSAHLASLRSRRGRLKRESTHLDEPSARSSRAGGGREVYRRRRSRGRRGEREEERRSGGATNKDGERTASEQQTKTLIELSEALRCSCWTFYHSGLRVPSERLFIHTRAAREYAFRLSVIKEWASPATIFIYYFPRPLRP